MRIGPRPLAGLRWLAVAVGTLLAATAQAWEPSVEFTAKAVMQKPDGSQQTARVYVGEGGIRTEFVRNGQQWVEIVKPAENQRLLLHPGNRTYEQARLPEGVSHWEGGVERISHPPCQDMEGARCKLLKEEQLRGRPAEKWQITLGGPGLKARALVWVDQKERWPLRQILPDGTVQNRRLLEADTKVAGRSAQKWGVRVSTPSGRLREYQQWYDPELGLVLRHRSANGFSRELHNIQVGEQEASLFRVPEGYSRRAPRSGHRGQGR
jgi:hypothetical protein